MIRAKIVSFTARGAALGARAAQALPGVLCERYARKTDPSLRGTRLTRFAQQAMMDCDLIVFIGATGIAVRAVAPYLMGKAYDPAVLVLDEGGRFVISLLSGHLGGANALAQKLADGLGAQAVVTTATDVRQVFAADNWAKANRCIVHDPEQIKYVSGALLADARIGLSCEFPVDGLLPAGMTLGDAPQTGIAIGFDTTAQPFAQTLHLVPRIVHLGLGCRRGASAAQVEGAVRAALEAAGIPLCAVKQAASIALKADEAGIHLFCKRYQIPFVTYSAETLAGAVGAFTPSDFVTRITGVDCVCERAAVVSADGGKLRLHKTVRDDVTVALAIEDWRVCFESEHGWN